MEETRLLLEKDFKKDKKIALRHLTGEGMDPYLWNGNVVSAEAV